MMPRSREIEATASKTIVVAGHIHRGAGNSTGTLKSSAAPMPRNADQIPQIAHPANTAPMMAVQNGGCSRLMLRHDTTHQTGDGRRDA